MDTESILIIDDEPSLQRFFEYNVRRLGFETTIGGSLADMFRLLKEKYYPVVLLDLMLPDGEALEDLPALIEQYPHIKVVLVSAHGTIPKAVTAIKQGAINFLQKPVSPEALDIALYQAIELWRIEQENIKLRKENKKLKRRFEPIGTFYGMIGQSEVMQNIYSTIESVAGTRAPVMITGESGTGKELVATALHKFGPRKNEPFIAINCAAIPHDLLESEIFGHEKGAFTGAIDQYKGCFERANGGTLFLDEICEMDPGLQVKLLRLIQEQTFFRIGGSDQIKIEVRIIAATNKNPLEMIKNGKFREDLFYRLNVLPIALPPLRDRREDIAMIASRYLLRMAAQNGKRFQGFDVEALRVLATLPWSGNVRELRNVIEQIVVLNDGELVTLAMFPKATLELAKTSAQEQSEPERDSGGEGRDGKAAPVTSGSIQPFWHIERDEIQKALDACRGNVQEVSRRLEISAATLYRKIEKYGLVK